MTPARKALAAVMLAVLLLAAVVVQLTVVNRLPLPGGAVPDLVLLLVTAIAVATTPALAAVTGFAAGLAVDIAPPAAHYAGEYALVFCLAAYAASRVSHAISDATGERDPVTAFTVMAVATAAGEAGKAALGMLLSDPDVTTAAVSRLLPGAVLYDLLLSPFAFWLVARITREAAVERAPAPAFSRDQRPVSVFRQASAGAAPELHLAGTGAAYGPPPPARRLPSLRLAGTGKNYKTQPVAGRAPKLNLSGASSRSVPRTAAAFSGSASSPLARPRPRKLNFAGDLSVRAGTRPARTPRKNWLKGAASPARAGAPRSADEAVAARSAPSGLSALTGAGTPLARRRGPQAGWLSGSRSASAPGAAKAPRASWLGHARGRPRTVIGSTVRGRAVIVTGAGIPKGAFRRRRSAASGTGHSAAPSGAWLRRSRGPWRKRGFLPGGRSPAPPGARPTARTAIVPDARKPRLFRLLGGRR